MMKKNILQVVFILLLIDEIYGCCNNTSTNCCNNNSSTNCCDNRPSTGCCNYRPSTNCCSNCHTCTTSICLNICQSRCCDKPTPPQPTIPPPHPQPSDSKVDNTINNANNLTNTVTNTNSISVPINISNNNLNNIHVQMSCGGGSYPSPLINCTTSTAPPITVIPPPNPINITVPQLIPVPIPVPGPTIVKKVIWPVPIPMPPITPPSPQCCTHVVPCFEQNCRPHTQMCGPQCVSPIIYTPRNPCINGCHRRPFYIGNICESGGCHYNAFDCSSCSQGFYENYQSYQQCLGCYSPGNSMY